MRRVLSMVSSLLTACAAPGLATEPVQYGSTDDRREVYEEPAGVHRTIAETAVAMQISEASLDLSDPSDVRVTYSRTLAEAQDLCAGVRYEDQIEPGTCSGTLIDDRHVLTAGHCVSAAEDCDGASWPWLFGFAYEAAGALAPRTGDDVYYCVRTVVLRDDGEAHYAVIELDRPGVGRAPARVRTATSLPALGTPVTLIGHPNGIPMKIAHGAEVRAHAGADWVADVDAFSANSGSGVFDDGGELIGILVSGADDYVNAGGCYVVNVIDPVPEGEGENVTGVRVALDAFCAAPGVTSSACGAEPDAGIARDAGRVADDGSTPDAAIAPVDAARLDGGSTAPASGDGCGCRAGARSASPAAMALAALLLALGLRPSRRRAGGACCTPASSCGRGSRRA